MTDLSDLRDDYEAPPLYRADLDLNPVVQFDGWMQEADATLPMANAAALATAGTDNRPSARVVLLKGYDAQGFVFYTDYESRKGRELAANPEATLLFYWQPLHRQVRIQGRVEKVTSGESDRYFDSRPLGSRLAASISTQSKVIESRQILEEAMAKARREVGEAVRRPSRWGGFRLQPDEFEFWQGRPNRLHDRFRYSRDGQSWKIERLMP